MKCPNCGYRFSHLRPRDDEPDELDAGCPNCGWLPGEEPRCHALVSALDKTYAALEACPPADAPGESADEP